MIVSACDVAQGSAGKTTVSAGRRHANLQSDPVVFIKMRRQRWPLSVDELEVETRYPVIAHGMRFDVALAEHRRVLGQVVVDKLTEIRNTCGSCILVFKASISHGLAKGDDVCFLL